MFKSIFLCVYINHTYVIVATAQSNRTYKKIEMFLQSRFLSVISVSSEIMASTLYVYIVLENGELYPKLYPTYDAARAAALHNHAEILDYERSECAEWGGGMASQVDVDENKETGTTKLYVEKEIYITIQRYKVEM